MVDSLMGGWEAVALAGWVAASGSSACLVPVSTVSYMAPMTGLQNLNLRFSLALLGFS